MKQLTITGMANARLRANRRQYIRIFLYIFLSIFLITSFVLGINGVFSAEQENRRERFGSLDVVVLDNGILRDKQLQEEDLFEKIGHAYLLGSIDDRVVNLGYYDETALELLEIAPLEGRMPESPDEIALERSALNILAVDWKLGDQVTLEIQGGIRHLRNFTVVGFLPERSIYLRYLGGESIGEFPIALTCPKKGENPAQTHYLTKLKKGVTLDQALETLSVAMKYRPTFYGLDFGGRQRQYSGFVYTLDVARSLFDRLLGITSLAAALVFSCGIGISLAMETMLAKRQEEIGILRALGATRRQIRQIFGRETILLASLATPISVGLGCMFVWLLSLWMPEQVKFGLEPKLVIPILLFSFLTVLLSGYLPLRRASKCMPMGAIRASTSGKGRQRIKPQKDYDPARLLAARKLRFHPTRSLGASILVCIMLLCSGYFLVLAVQSGDTGLREPAFELFYSGGMSFVKQVYVSDAPEITQADLDEIHAIAQVESVVVERRMPITAVLEQVPRYAVLGKFENVGMLPDELLEEARIWERSGFLSDSLVSQQRRAYQVFRKEYEIEGCPYATELQTAELTPENLQILQSVLESGTIDPEAIDRGEQVLVVAPDVWAKRGKRGNITYYLETGIPEDAERIAWNDTISAGDQLPLVQLYYAEIDGPVIRRDAEVTVGGIVQGASFLNIPALTVPAILTTEKGLAAMHLQPVGVKTVQIYLDGIPSMEEERTLEQEISAIARRSAYLSTHNNLQRLRERNLARNQTILLFSSLSLLFFAVSVGMIVSTVTRQLDADSRTIGMLRAVGADEKTLLNCYQRQFTSGILRGLVLSLLLILLAAFWILWNDVKWGITPDLNAPETKQLLLMSATACIMSGICWLTCRSLLRLQIRSVVGRSIIDSIKEL